MNGSDKYCHRRALAGGDLTNWYTLTTEPNYETWPLTMTVVNNEETNTVTVRFKTSTLTLFCEYNDIFESGSDLVVGWIPDPTDQGIEFSSITVTR